MHPNVSSKECEKREIYLFFKTSKKKKIQKEKGEKKEEKEGKE